MLDQAALYASSTASTTSGSIARSAGDRRIRLVRLLRPRKTAAAFGFSLRGGKEHNAGFFISKVEPNSEAQRQGLRVGDQVVTVNGYRVEDAVHSELVHYVSSQTRLKIKVRNVGVVPVKDRGHEPLQWACVEGGGAGGGGGSLRSASRSTASSSPPPPGPPACEDRLREGRISLLVPPNAKLGCGICKGPEWKPGIFVQFIKECGIARDSGLRPGDQILACNGVDFRDIQFNDAVHVMKQCGRLELVVRGGVGCELVSPSPESSGYNSSASSAAGERSPPAPAAPAPPHQLRHRLASVAEEAADRADRLTLGRLKRRTWGSMDFDWHAHDIHSFDAPSDIEPDYDSPGNPDSHSYEPYSRNKKDYISNPSNKTIINLTEHGATIQCTYDHHVRKHSTVPKSKIQTKDNEDKKLIKVEVHHRQSCHRENSKTNTIKSTDTSKSIDSSTVPLGPSMDGLMSDTTSISSNTTLSSAIIQEIQRRKLKPIESSKPAPDTSLTQPKKPSLLKTVDDEKQKQHDALMDEFKKVHKKMFSERHEDVAPKPAENGEVAEDRQPTVPPKKVPMQEKVNGVKPSIANGAPPPPPPMPIQNDSDTSCSDTGIDAGIDVKSEAQRLSQKQPILTNGKNSSIKRIPTPDYEPNTIDTLTAKLKIRSKEDVAELESIDSYKLKNPLSPQAKPPPTYFTRPPNGTATLKKNTRPLSVTIGEYPNGAIRKEPSKLDFLNVETKNNGLDMNDNVPIGSRLQSELVMTLSKSNLRRKTENDTHPHNTSGNSKMCGFLSPLPLVIRQKERKLVDKTNIDNTSSTEESDQSIDKNFHKRYGNNILPMPPALSIPKVPGIKANLTRNKISGALEAKLNGIYNGMIKDPAASCNLDADKKITFNHVLTVVGDKK